MAGKARPRIVKAMRIDFTRKRAPSAIELTCIGYSPFLMRAILVVRARQCREYIFLEYFRGLTFFQHRAQRRDQGTPLRCWNILHERLLMFSKCAFNSGDQGAARTAEHESMGPPVHGLTFDQIALRQSRNQWSHVRARDIQHAPDLALFCV